MTASAPATSSCSFMAFWKPALPPRKLPRQQPRLLLKLQVLLLLLSLSTYLCIDTHTHTHIYICLRWLPRLHRTADSCMESTV